MRPDLQVRRLGASELGEHEKIYFDEELEVFIETTEYCEVQLSAQIEGHGQTVMIFEESLSLGKSWHIRLPVRLPRTRLTLAELEIVAVALMPNRHASSPTEADPYMPQTQSELEILFPAGMVPLNDCMKAVKDVEQEPDPDSLAKFRRKITQALVLDLHSKAPYIEKEQIFAEVCIESQVRDVCLIGCQVSIEDGIVVPMPSPVLPLTLGQHERCAFTYNLQTISTAQKSMRKMHFILQYKIGKAHVTTEWTPAINIDNQQGPLPKTPLIGNLRSPIPKVGPSRSLGGLNLLFDGPSIVNVGDRFEWKFRAINHSQRSRKIILGLHPRDKLGPPPARDRKLVATIDGLRNRITAHRVALGAERGIIPLTHEIKINALGPSACFDGSITLLALRPGTHTIDGSTLLDILTGDIYEIGELLEVTVLPKASA